MNQQNTLITISGSLREDSYNQKVASEAQSIAENLAHKTINIRISDYPLPLFSEDIEKQETPESLVEIRRIFSNASSLLIASPEYNGSFSAALKNLLDWLSRPALDYKPPFSRYTVALTAASPGGLGGLRGLGQLRELMTNLGSIVIPQQLAIGSAHTAFNEDGRLNDPKTQERLESLVQTLIETDQKLNKPKE